MVETKITGRQVAMLIGMMIERGINGERRQLEWLEEEAGVYVAKFEDITPSRFNVILLKLRAL